jgi:hypothetical protein
MLTRNRNRTKGLWKTLWISCGKPVDACGKKDMWRRYEKELDKIYLCMIPCIIPGQNRSLPGKKR